MSLVDGYICLDVRCIDPITCEVLRQETSWLDVVVLNCDARGIWLGSLIRYAIQGICSSDWLDGYEED